MSRSSLLGRRSQSFTKFPLSVSVVHTGCVTNISYAFHIAQAQAFLDGIKRTAIGAALVFLERSGVETRTEWGEALYNALHAVAQKRMDKSSLADLIRPLMASNS